MLFWRMTGFLRTEALLSPRKVLPALPSNGPGETVQNPQNVSRESHRNNPPPRNSLGSFDLTNPPVLYAKTEKYFDFINIHNNITTDIPQYCIWHPQNIYSLSGLRKWQVICYVS